MFDSEMIKEYWLQQRERERSKEGHERNLMWFRRWWLKRMANGKVQST